MSVKRENNKQQRRNIPLKGRPAEYDQLQGVEEDR